MKTEEDINKEYKALIDPIVGENNRMLKKIYDLNKKISKNKKEIKKLNDEKLLKIGRIKDDFLKEEYGISLEIGETINISYDLVPDEFKNKRNKRINVFSNIVFTDKSDIIIEIRGKTNLRYNFTLSANNDEKIIKNLPFYAVYGVRLVSLSMNKEKFIDFLIKSSRKLNRNYKLKKLGI